MFAHITSAMTLISRRTALLYCSRWLFRPTSLVIRNNHHVAKEGPCNQYRILFLGSDNFALTHLKALDENRQLPKEQRVVKDLEVVISKAKTQVAKYSTEQGLPVHQWPIPTVHGQYDLGVIVSFGHLIPKRVINMFPNGMLNVHPSQLPKYRGAAPILHSILHGDDTTAISIMEIRPKKFDIGPVLVQEIVPIPEHSTAFQLSELLAERGAQLLLDTIGRLDILARVGQERLLETPSSAPKLKSGHARVDWFGQTCQEIYRQYRALGEIYQLQSRWQGAPVRLLDMQPPGGDTAEDVPVPVRLSECGTVIYLKKRQTIAVRCRDGWVEFSQVVYKKPMSAKAFYNGYLGKLPNERTMFESLDNGLHELAAVENANVKRKMR